MSTNYTLPSPLLSGVCANADETIKFIVVSGGVCSSLGKGVTCSSIGALLKGEGYRVTSIKIDPYLNIDAGLMSPYEHGEVYVLGDGGEVDLDLGNYERWMAVRLSRDHNITTGKMYHQITTKERNGDYIGKTVTVVPHFTNHVVEHIERVAAIPVDDTGKCPQVCLIELGGTVGDLESVVFLEALCTMQRFTVPREDFCLVHCTYLPEMGGSQKTKPTQHSCRALNSHGLVPDFLVCRGSRATGEAAKSKLSQLCGVPQTNIIDAHDVSCLYEIPVMFSEQRLVEKLSERLQLTKAFGAVVPPINFPTVDSYRGFAKVLASPATSVTIAFVGKYTGGGSDAYFSVMQTFEHCCLALGVGIRFLWIDSELLEGDQSTETAAALEGCDGIFVPGGFGLRGFDGKVRACAIARERKIPYFGVCLGMQVALVESARNQLGLADANSSEMDPASANHVILRMEEDTKTMGANMHLGNRTCHVIDPEGTSIISRVYGGAAAFTERHRHRFEFNMSYRDRLAASGLRFTCASEPSLGDRTRVEGVELAADKHPFFLAVQYHPEFITTPSDPSPPYVAFIAAAAKIDYAFPCGNSRAV